MATAPSPRKQHALEMFGELPARYDEVGAALSFFQDPRWRRAVVEAVEAGPDDRVLDIACGTGLVSGALVKRWGCRVVGLDQSAAMLGRARAKLAADPQLAARITRRGRSRAPPLRRRRVRPPHLHLPAALRRRPGGDAAGAGAGGQAGRAGLEPRVLRPAGGLVLALAPLHPGRPAGCSAGSPRGAGSRPAASSARASRASTAAIPCERQVELWEAAGIERVDVRRDEPRRRRRHLGHRWRLSPSPRPAFYALRPGGWRDLVTVLHPPYTLWHVSNVAIGAAAAPQLYPAGWRRRSRPSSSPSGSAPTPSTSCRGDRWARSSPARTLIGAGRRSASAARWRSASPARSSSPRPSRPWSCSAASSSSPTTSSCSAAASTPTSGSPPPGAASRPSPAGGRTRSACTRRGSDRRRRRGARLLLPHPRPAAALDPGQGAAATDRGGGR